MCVFYSKDSIEANVENAEVHVQQANQQLSRAAEYQVISAVLNCPVTSMCVCVSVIMWLEMLTSKIPWKTGQKYASPLKLGLACLFSGLNKCCAHRNGQFSM